MAATNASLEARRLLQRIQLDLLDTFLAVTERTLKLGGQRLENVVQTYADQATNGSALKKVNQALADEMRIAMVKGYKNNVLLERIAPSYRKGDPKRFAGGALLHALEDRSQAVGTANGIGFVNGRLLDRAAAQWYRLNSGAAPGQGYSGQEHQQINARVRFGSNQGFSVKFGDGPGTGFNVPQSGFGHFDSGKFFIGFPGKRSQATGRFQNPSDIRIVRSRPSSGIRARRFIDQGLVALAENFGPFYETHFEKTLEKVVSENRVTNVGPA